MAEMTCRFGTWRCEKCTQRCAVAGMVLTFKQIKHPPLPDGAQPCARCGKEPRLAYSCYGRECRQQIDRQYADRARARRQEKRRTDPVWAEHEREQRRKRRARSKAGKGTK